MNKIDVNILLTAAGVLLALGLSPATALVAVVAFLCGRYLR